MKDISAGSAPFQGYSKRFINALGSANIYTHGAACNSSKEAGFAQTIGTGNFSVDFGNSKMVVFIGRSYGDGIRPSSVQSLAAAADKGTRIVIVDPRLNNSGIFATDWVSIKPGTDLAFLLGICNVLIEEDLYDHEFVEQNAVGFEEFAAQAKEYTPAWAEQQCGVPAATIEEIARALAKAAPAAAVEASWRAAFGCAHQNSFDTARAVTAVNALLGSWGAKEARCSRPRRRRATSTSRSSPPLRSPRPSAWATRSTRSLPAAWARTWPCCRRRSTAL